MKKNLVITVAVIALIVGIVAGVAVTGLIKSNMPEEIKLLDSVTVEEVLKPAGELITSKYYYTDLDMYETYKELFGKKVPFTSDKVAFTYKGVISIGMDLKDIKFDIDNENKVINMHLPQPKILSHETKEDEFTYYDIENSIFTESSFENYGTVINQLKKKQENKIENDPEIYASVTENAKTLLKGFLTSAESTKDYKVIFDGEETQDETFEDQES